MKPVKNIEELARLAGVSKSTVSRALNDNPVISSETRKTIKDLATEHNFYLDKTASSLSSGKTFCIGITICNQILMPGDLPNTFHSEVLNYLSSFFPQNGYDVMLLNTESQKDDWPSRYFLGKRADAFVVLSLANTEKSIKGLLKVRAPFLVFGEDCSRYTMPSVRSDNEKGAILAVNHILESGRRKIAFIRGLETSTEARDREAGFRKAMDKAGIEVREEWMYPGDFSYRSGIAAVRKFFNNGKKPEAVFSSSDIAALGAMDEMKRRNIRVPQDIAVVGYDNIRFCEHYDPPLTTISQDTKVFAEKICENLLIYINTGRAENTVLVPELVERASV
ncbi:MAG: LacI family DNA-binding transcriptional regulator [Spirochaetales bacterium]|nr:LacI family DNA-binding transcriptional regulator [Spirochaetales bacterium]